MPSCNTCKKGPPEVSLKHCAKCSSMSYCSRDCQKADWKSHKKVCAKGGGSPAEGGAFSAGSDLSPPKGLHGPIARPFTRLDSGTWLHDRPEADVYRLLIDTYRLKVEDMYRIDGEVDKDSIYDGAEDGLQGFRRFLQRVASRRGLLPSWWNPGKQTLCETLGMDGSQWSDLRCAVEKADIIEHYGDPRFPMQLRMFAESVYGYAPGGMDGTPMRTLMAAMEQGGMGDAAAGLTIDNTTMNASMMRT